jgi:glutamate synthase (NADPH/NADH) small chain
MHPDKLTLESDYQDFKAALTSSEVITEANRCLYCYDAPCIRACPTEINIPQFIGRIASSDGIGAAKTILDSNILGHSCANVCPTEVLCEGACVYQSLNHKPISIGKLQRFAVEQAYKFGVQFYTPGPSTGRRVALIGAGPASLACAHELRKKGHETVIFEKSSLPGGLNTFGIAPYKMKVGASLREIEMIASMGIDFKYDQELGRNLHLTELMESFDSVFLGIGLGADSFPNISGIEEPEVRPRVKGATNLIAEIKTAPLQSSGWLKTLKSVLVIGGGNTALDICRELKGLGIPQVLCCYRKAEGQMSGYAHELKAARIEGVEFQFHTLPIQIGVITQDSGKPHALKVKLIRTDHPLNVETQEGLTVEAGLVVLATGQAKLQTLLEQTPGLEFQEGRLKVEPETCATGNPKIYAGGDLTNGGKEVVNAVAEGKKAAWAIHKRLSLKGMATHG